jgi:excisionase family DNA binding protein
VRKDADVQPSQPVREAFKVLATPLLPGGPTIRSDALLTVREAARFLRVSTATVYKLCARGELAHVRVLNVIRIPAKVVDSGALKS